MDVEAFLIRERKNHRKAQIQTFARIAFFIMAIFGYIIIWIIYGLSSIGIFGWIVFFGLISMMALEGIFFINHERYLKDIDEFYLKSKMRYEKAKNRRKK